MKKRRAVFAALLLAVALLVVGGGLLYQDFGARRKAQNEYESLARLAREETGGISKIQSPDGETPAETKAPLYESPIQFEELRKINPDLVGWIKIEGTRIDYPIVQAADNETYLHQDFQGNESVAGVIYLDYESKADFSGQHNLLYGHNMKNGAMLKDIVKYKDEAFFNEHQNIIVYTPEREYHLTPITVLYTEPVAERRRTWFTSPEHFRTYVKEMTAGGLYLQNQEEPMERLWSFVTCSYEFDDARTILYAREVNP